MDEQRQHIDWDAAIDRIKAGRGTGLLMDANGNVCMVGAVCVGLGYSDDTLKLSSTDGGAYEAYRHGMDVAKRTLLPIAKEQFPERCARFTSGMGVALFNDDHRTTDDDVILVLEKARARSGEVL